MRSPCERSMHVLYRLIIYSSATSPTPSDEHWANTDPQTACWTLGPEERLRWTPGDLYAVYRHETFSWPESIRRRDCGAVAVAFWSEILDTRCPWYPAAWLDLYLGWSRYKVNLDAWIKVSDWVCGVWWAHLTVSLCKDEGARQLGWESSMCI